MISDCLSDYIVHEPIRLSGGVPDPDDYTLEDLREIPAGAAGFFPFSRFEAAHFCPLCDCARSNDVDVPNPRQEPCEDPGCRCHDE